MSQSQMTDWTTIPLTSSTRDDLKERKAPGQSWDGVITDLLTDDPDPDAVCAFTDEQVQEIIDHLAAPSEHDPEPEHEEPPTP